MNRASLDIFRQFPRRNWYLHLVEETTTFYDADPLQIAKLGVQHEPGPSSIDRACRSGGSSSNNNDDNKSDVDLLHLGPLRVDLRVL
jgi:hypothetical protein